MVVKHKTKSSDGCVPRNEHRFLAQRSWSEAWSGTRFQMSTTSIYFLLSFSSLEMREMMIVEDARHLLFLGGWSSHPQPTMKKSTSALSILRPHHSSLSGVYPSFHFMIVAFFKLLIDVSQPTASLQRNEGFTRNRQGLLAEARCIIGF